MPLARYIILSIGPIWNNHDPPTDDFYCCTIVKEVELIGFFIDLTKQMTLVVNFVKTEKNYFIIIIIKCVILIKESSNKFQFFHLRFQLFSVFLHDLLLDYVFGERTKLGYEFRKITDS